MAKEIKVIVRDKNTLILEEDAFKGDYIDILNLSKIDSSYISDLINRLELEEKEKIKNNVQKELRKEFDATLSDSLTQKENEVKNKYIEKENELRKQINQLEKDLEVLKASKESSIKEKVLLKENEMNLEINDLKHEKDSLSEEIKNLTSRMEEKSQIAIDALKMTHEKEVQDLKNKLAQLDQQIQLNERTKELEIKEALQSEKDSFDKEKTELNEEIEHLRRTKMVLGTKQIGEDLEKWCLNEYRNYETSGFEDCTFEKDNTVIRDDGDSKGTKADFIFKVFEDDRRGDNNVLTSVCLEMKNESLEGGKKVKNEAHFSKLNQDRVKKNCEYALLVSTLEWENENDSVIRKIPGYEKMYLVRPQYFISFLSLIYSLAKKYREVLKSNLSEKLQLKDKKDLMEEFEDLKRTYFEKPLDNLEKQIENILKQAGYAKSAILDIEASANKVSFETIQTMREKIERFNIKKITKQLDKIEE